jgi:Holliday junction resolvasome RuvABC ATP-dependent DNA helicase subunit
VLNYKVLTYVLGGILLALIAAVCLMVMELGESRAQTKAAVIQNVQLTKEVRQAKVQGYRDGLFALENTDVAYLNDLAVQYADVPVLAKLFSELAQGWAYDDDTINQMVESYMNADTH